MFYRTATQTHKTSEYMNISQINKTSYITYHTTFQIYIPLSQLNVCTIKLVDTRIYKCTVNQLLVTKRKF